MHLLHGSQRGFPVRMPRLADSAVDSLAGNFWQKRMKTCEACSLFEGKPAGVEPHDMMFGERANVRSDGSLEQFKCRSCGRNWERFEHNRMYYGEPQFWRPF
jgi:hypothetical protein